MELAWLILIPLLAGGLAFAVPSERARTWILPIGSGAHLALVWQCLGEQNLSAFDGWLNLDPLGKIFLAEISVVFFLCMCYAPFYLAMRPERKNRVLCACLLWSLSVMSLVCLSHHLGLMWVAMEASTLLTAPGLYFNHNPRSLEATWKYLLICSVGIALALLGSFFLAYSALHAGQESTLLFDDLVKQAPKLSRPWLHAAFVLLFVGYGTKMGLVPMHTWKPDAYGEATGLVGAILAGGVTNCAFLAILRIYQIDRAAHDEVYSQGILAVMGLITMLLAAFSMARQRDLKRMLAYSSVEHMGILAFGIGIGGSATAGALLHVIHNGLTKGVLFLSAGNIHRAFGTKSTDQLRGVIHRLPFSGGMFLAGFLAITGSPPFAPFVSEYQILVGTLQGQNYISAGLFALALLVVFIGMGSTLMAVLLGKPDGAEPTHECVERWGTCLPIAVFMALVCVLGVYSPPELKKLIDEAAKSLG